MMKIIIIDKVHNYLPSELQKRGFHVADMQNIEPEKVVSSLNNFDGIVIRSKIKLTAEILSNLPKLKFIARVGAGMESIDKDFAEKQGIKLMNAPEGNRDSVGEHAVGMILNLFNKICSSNLEVKSGIWQREPNRGIELMGKTVGIIGYGNMGSAFAKRLSSFGVNVISYDKYKTNYADSYTKEVYLKEIYEETDILSLHVPLQDDTFYMVDDNFIKKFKKPIYIINTARGKNIKTDDLVQNLKSGKILGAALDVLEYEKVSFETIANQDNPAIEFLKNASNIILTPHVAGLTYDSNLKLAKVVVDKIEKYLQSI